MNMNEYIQLKELSIITTRCASKRFLSAT